jgi:hypothetical protein
VLTPYPESRSCKSWNIMGGAVGGNPGYLFRPRFDLPVKYSLNHLVKVSR